SCSRPLSLHDALPISFAGQSERVNAELVSGTYFSVLGVNTILGRAFTPEDDRVPLGHPLAMLTYDYWKRRFGGDPGIVGKNLIEIGRASCRERGEREE